MSTSEIIYKAIQIIWEAWYVVLMTIGVLAFLLGAFLDKYVYKNDYTDTHTK